MIKRLFWANAVLGFIVLFSAISDTAHGQVLTINDGSSFTISGGSLYVNCLDILINSGGTLELQSGGIVDRGKMTVQPGGTYTYVSGTVQTCTVEGSTFYIIYKPDGSPAAVISLPKN